MKRLSLLGAVLGLSLVSCSLVSSQGAVSELRDSTGKVIGSATFAPEGMGTRVKVIVRGLTPGMHGMHVHQNPSCTDTTDATGKVTVFGGAGGHFDPENAAHHGSPQTPNTQGHGGDIPMLEVGADGAAVAEFLTTKVSLGGANSVLNRSLVIHADPDDYKTDPAGNSGARIACGVILAR